jgi:hypothetical protein
MCSAIRSSIARDASCMVPGRELHGAVAIGGVEARGAFLESIIRRGRAGDAHVGDSPVTRVGAGRQPRNGR